MRSADLYVQPSFSEGFSTTICEAAILGKAIIGTIPSGGIREQITDGFDGRIVGADVDSLIKAISELIDNSLLRIKFEENIQLKKFNGSREIEKFHRYME